MIHDERASVLMTRFLERTGITTERPPIRYLWTDAYAVCNLLELSRTTGESRYGEWALRLIDSVHHTLGRHRTDDPRRGWISGLAEAEGEAHPTLGGLRIGKKLPERRAAEPFDEAHEWDRDGQYFHYLTPWMHALDQTARATRQPLFNRWARELAASASAAFCVGPRMVWKMSIDLTRPLVASMGQHDPLDGFVTLTQLRHTSRELEDTQGPGLVEETARFAAMIEHDGWATADPLGLGGLLKDASRVAELTSRGSLRDDRLLCRLLEAALVGILHYVRTGDLRRPPASRLAFRELGLALGLHGLEVVEKAARGPGFPASADLSALLGRLQPHVALAAEIESQWLRPENRHLRAWDEHRDINDVMLASTLLPAGTLRLIVV
jgi:hypothetical protein